MKKWIALFLCLIPVLVFADVDTFEGQTGTDTWEGSSNVDTREGSTVASGATTYSDDFSGSNVALATHDAQWTTITADVAILEIDGSGYAQPTGSYTSGSAYYAASSSDISQITVKGASYPAGAALRVCVRATDGNYGYNLFLSCDGTEWDLYLRKDSTNQAYPSEIM